MAQTKRYAQHEWVVLHQFPTYEDAKAFQALVEEAFGLPSIARPKGQYESAKNVGEWRMTHAMREQLAGNSFDQEMLAIAAEKAHFSGTSAQSWLSKALKYNVIRRLEKGIYEFLPIPDGNGSPQAGGAQAQQHSAAGGACPAGTPTEPYDRDNYGSGSDGW